MMQFYTTVINGEVVLRAAYRNDEIVTIPSEVKVIDDCAFRGKKHLREIQLPDGLKSIGYNAFADCSSLKTVVLPEGLKVIRSGAFSGCSNLQTVVFPEGLERIEEKAFEGCSSLRTIALPKGLKELGWNAFRGCSSLQSITLPMGLEELNIETFWGCRNLQSIALPESLKRIGRDAFLYCESLRTIALPKGLKELGWSAFRGCSSLKSITLPDGLVTINSSTFENCSSLQTITLPEGLKGIGEHAFEGCSSLQTIMLPEGLKGIGEHAFEGCSSLQTITLPKGLLKIEERTFAGCSGLQTITLPEGLEEIKNNAFEGCSSLRTIILPEGLKIIGREAFSSCLSLQTIDLPGSLEEIRYEAFSGCINLQTIDLPQSLKGIGGGAFSNCNRLKIITLPDGLKWLGKDAFSGCKDLRVENIHLRKVEPLSDGFCDLNLEPTDEEFAYLWLYQNSKAWCAKLDQMKVSNPDRVFDRMVALLKESGSTTFDALVCFMLKNASGLRSEQLKSTLEWLEEMKYRGIKKLKAEPLIESALSGEAPKESFFHTTDRKIEVPGVGTFNFCTKDTLPYQLAEEGLNLIDEEIAYVALYQKSDKWKKWLNRVRLDDPVHVFNCMIELWLQDKSVTSRLTSFMIDHIAKLQMEQVQEAISILQKRGTKAQIQSVMDCPEVALLVKGEPLPEQPIEALVDELIPFYVREIRQIDEIVTGVHYADSELRSSRDAVVLLIAAGFCEADQKIANFGEGSNMHIKRKLYLDDDLLRVANALNRSELLEQLVNLYKNAKTQNMKYLLAWALLADDASIRKETMYFKEKREGKRQPIAEVYATRFLMYNDSLAAMQLFDRLNMLDEYAQMRGMTAMEMRDSTMLPDFHFDADGAKRYDIGGNIIEARITPELKFQLFDGNKGKELRSFPKKSDDPEKLAACAAEYDKFKWDALSLAKERAQLLHKLHMSGEFIQPVLWRKVYVEHQLIRHLAQLVVWEDEAKRSFMTVDGETIDSQGQPYSPQGAIRVAHVLDMTAEDIAAWQLWLTRQGRKQLFEQVWEPVILWDKDGIQSRYDGVVLSSSARNAVKKHLAQRGVDVWAEDMARSYDRRTNSFSFSNKSVLHFGHCLSLNYKVDDASRETTFGLTHDAALTAYRRELNAVLLEMDRAAISAQILKDDDAALTDAALASFTAAQISEFLNLAIDQKCPRCTAKLLDYKNQRFPEFSEMDEFTLDW